MKDSSEHVTEPTKVIGFDLERARGLRDFLQDDCAEVGDIWGEMIAEIERLRADLEQAERVIEARLEVIDDQAARIKSLKKEIRRLKHESKVEQEFTNSYIKRLHDAEARIKELEDAHKRSGAKYAKIINELRSSVYANIPGLDVGKIGPDATKPQSWQITEERKAALGQCIFELEDIMSDRPFFSEELAVLRAMLREAE